MQVGHRRDGLLKPLVARRERPERRIGYCSVVDIGAHDRGIVWENQLIIQFIAILNEDALVTNRLESRSGKCKSRPNLLVGVAALAEVHEAAVTIDFRRRESRRQDLLPNCLCRDLIEWKVSARLRFAAGS